MVWYSHFFQNFPQFVVIHSVKGFGVVNNDMYISIYICGIPSGSAIKRICLQYRRLAGDAGLIPGSGRSHGVENGKLLQDSCLGNPIDRGG